MVELNLKYIVSNKLSKIVGVVLLLLFTSTQVLPNIIQAGGVIDENTIWTSNDTVEVYADLIVPSGLTLIIEGGANIRLNINTGIVIDEGNLLVLGTLIDSVSFVPDYRVPGLTWKWKGIIIKHANIENQSKIIYAHIANAETGIRIEESYSVEVSSTTISNCQNLGIQFINSSSCFIADCRLESNYDGIEIIATYLGGSSNNIIYNSLLRNQNNNIYVYSEDGGIYQNNLIVGNIIDSGINGIWVDNNGGSTNSNNVIEKNIFINNGFDVGYGLFLVHDSTTVRNNIFWKNSIAVYSGSGADNCKFINNSFYQNDWAIAIGPGSKANQYTNNTFELNKTEIFGIKETDGVVFSNNNLMYTGELENIVVNNTSNDLLIDENFWGTTDTILINKLIYDKNDNPNLGELIYHPFLVNIDTSNPISPPYKVIKQLINNIVQVTWFSNKEADLKGYRVYYDELVDYSFAENFELGSDTTFAFPNDISIYSDIAVTSFDSAINQADAQVLGNESPFSFAAIYPYSGPDTIICKHLEELKIVHSNIPMAYNSLFWKTSGDGIFSNSTIQSPTYFPGFVDIESGGAQLSLYVVISNDTLVDEFNLSIIDD
ncbi:MAG: right-handed parallel beta-helix repeat-containing protein, partial [Bacteroidota bacterium]